MSTPSTAQDATDEASSTSTDAVHALLHGIAVGVGALASLVFFLAMTLLSLVFLLTDGPKIRAWGERHMGVPLPIARTITGRTIESLRGYFLGTTIVAGFNGVVVGLGAWLLDVPLAGTIAVITFFAAYIPYLGAWTAGAFSVLLALGGAGTDAAVGMIVIQILANGVLQQMVQPLAMGTALGIHPLAVLIVTIAGGALFGTVGLILAAPITSAITRISADLTGVRAEDRDRPAGDGAGHLMPPRILIAYDGSDVAKAAVRHAAELFPGSTAVVVSVWEPGLGAMIGVSPGFDMAAAAPVPFDPELASEFDRAEEHRAEVVAQEGAQLAGSLGLKAEPHAIADETRVADAITDAAAERKVAAVVVGSHGISGLRSRLLGSTSRRVLERCEIPVVVVRA